MGPRRPSPSARTPSPDPAMSRGKSNSLFVWFVLSTSWSWVRALVTCGVHGKAALRN